MSSPTSTSRPAGASIRWRSAWGWGAFFLLVIAGIALFWQLGADAPIMHDVGATR